MKHIVVCSAVLEKVEAVQKKKKKKKKNIYIYIYIYKINKKKKNKKNIIFHQAKKIPPSKSHKSLFIK